AYSLGLCQSCARFSPGSAASAVRCRGGFVLGGRSCHERPPNRLRGHSADRAFARSPSDRSKPLERLERVKGIEPSTRSLGSYCSTTELHPRFGSYTMGVETFATDAKADLPQNFHVICYTGVHAAACR